MKYRVSQVKTKADERAFLDVPRVLYGPESPHVCLLDAEMKGIFSPKKNTFFQHGEAQRFVLYDALGKLVGRVAAFVNRNKAFTYALPTGGMGFFECIEDYAAAELLMDTARDWLAERGMEAMDGPINFGENHLHWGLLSEGFTQTCIGMPYNPPYYVEFFERYGFRLYFQQISKRLDIRKGMPERLQKILAWVEKRGGVEVRHPKPNEVDEFGRYFQEIYNAAWVNHENFTPLTDEATRKAIAQLKLIMIPELMSFAFINGQPAGFILTLPDVNQIFKPWQGKLTLGRTLKFLWRKRNNFAWYRKRGELYRGRVIIAGIHPRFQKNGVETALVKEQYKQNALLGIHEVELGWVGDFNPLMQALVDNLEAAPAHVHKTYRFAFDPERRAALSRSEVIGGGEPVGPTP